MLGTFERSVRIAGQVTRVRFRVDPDRLACYLARQIAQGHGRFALLDGAIHARAVRRNKATLTSHPRPESPANPDEIAVNRPNGAKGGKPG